MKFDVIIGHPEDGVILTDEAVAKLVGQTPIITRAKDHSPKSTVGKGKVVAASSRVDNTLQVTIELPDNQSDEMQQLIADLGDKVPRFSGGFAAKREDALRAAMKSGNAVRLADANFVDMWPAEWKYAIKTKGEIVASDNEPPKDYEGNVIGWPPFYDLPTFPRQDGYEDYDICIVQAQAAQSGDMVGLAINCHTGQILAQHQSSSVEWLHHDLLNNLRKTRYETALGKRFESMRVFIIAGWSSAPEWLRVKVAAFYG